LAGLVRGVALTLVLTLNPDAHQFATPAAAARPFLVRVRVRVRVRVS